MDWEGREGEEKKEREHGGRGIRRGELRHGFGG